MTQGGMSASLGKVPLATPLVPRNLLCPESSGIELESAALQSWNHRHRTVNEQPWVVVRVK